MIIIVSIIIPYVAVHFINTNTTLTFTGNSVSLQVKILIPVALFILFVIVIACWRYYEHGNHHQNNDPELVEVTPMVRL